MILDTNHGRWAILTIGRLSFHVARGLAVIGWMKANTDYYHPSVRIEW